MGNNTGCSKCTSHEICHVWKYGEIKMDGKPYGGKASENHSACNRYKEK